MGRLILSSGSFNWRGSRLDWLETVEIKQIFKYFLDLIYLPPTSYILILFEALLVNIFSI